MKRLIYSFIILMFVSCSSQKADVVLIVGTDGVNIHGKVTMELTANGNYEPKIWVPGYIVVFRVDSEFGNSFGKAGTIYRITDKLLLEEIDEVDLKLSDEEIFKKYLSE